MEAARFSLLARRCNVIFHLDDLGLLPAQVIGEVISRTICQKVHLIGLSILVRGNLEKGGGK
jgi:hypothetical protein